MLGPSDETGFAAMVDYVNRLQSDRDGRVPAVEGAQRSSEGSATPAAAPTVLAPRVGPGGLTSKLCPGDEDGVAGESPIDVVSQLGDRLAHG
jgi:hypothetical protein